MATPNKFAVVPLVRVCYLPSEATLCADQDGEPHILHPTYGFHPPPPQTLTLWLQAVNEWFTSVDSHVLDNPSEIRMSAAHRAARRFRDLLAETPSPSVS